MTELLAAAEIAVATEVVKQVCEGADVAVASARTDRHHTVGLALEFGRHPCGMRQLPPPVIVSFDSEQWLRIAVGLRAMR